MTSPSWSLTCKPAPCARSSIAFLLLTRTVALKVGSKSAAHDISHDLPIEFRSIPRESELGSQRFDLRGASARYHVAFSIRGSSTIQFINEIARNRCATLHLSVLKSQAI